ncbi:hypothetical protein ACWGJ2_39855 [Streptomyces sp. NPDC054796]
MFSTRHPWHVQLSSDAAPLPPELAGLPVDVVTSTPLRTLTTVEQLRDRVAPVGPMRCCFTHGEAQVPVPRGTALRWSAGHSTCHSPARPTCTPGQQRCCIAFWFIPPGTPYLTEPEALYDGLSVSRSPASWAPACAA